MDQAIAERLDKGQELLERRTSAELYATSETGIPRLRNDFNTWDEYNEQLLRSRFSTDKVANDYRRVMYRAVTDRNPQQERQYVFEDISRQMRKLESIRLQLELYDSEGPSEMGASPR